MKNKSILISICLFTACAPIVLKAPMQNDADRAAQKFPGITLAELNQGKILFEQNCNKCHSLKVPFRKSEETLIKVVPQMAKKAKVDDATKDLILKYLITMREEQKRK